MCVCIKCRNVNSDHSLSVGTTERQKEESDPLPRVCVVNGGKRAHEVMKASNGKESGTVSS